MPNPTRPKKQATTPAKKKPAVQREVSGEPPGIAPESAFSRVTSGRGSLTAADVVALQDTGGNQAVMRLLQARRIGGEAESAAEVHKAAKVGIGGQSGALPHLQTIQKSFGHHDVTGVVAHTGAQAAAGAQAMGAAAFTMGNHVAFADRADLHTAAHEAAHVIQQRQGVQLAGGVGAAGDKYERHADAVADAVVQGRSVASMLDGFGGSSARGVSTGGGGAVPEVPGRAGAREARGAVRMTRALVQREIKKGADGNDHGTQDDIETWLNTQKTEWCYVGGSACMIYFNTMTSAAVEAGIAAIKKDLKLMDMIGKDAKPDEKTFEETFKRYFESVMTTGDLDIAVWDEEVRRKYPLKGEPKLYCAGYHEPVDLLPPVSRDGEAVPVKVGGKNVNKIDKLIQSLKPVRNPFAKETAEGSKTAKRQGREHILNQWTPPKS